MKSLTTILKCSIYETLFVLVSCSFNKHKPEVHVVEIKQMQFQPAVITIRKEDTIVFINKDIVMHNVTEQSKAAWSSSTMKPGDSFKLVPKENCNYFCTLHLVMKGKIEVQ
jgi:plastocyanin